jgi:glycosyltransferase involved in cell wall biosynthesis
VTSSRAVVSVGVPVYNGARFLPATIDHLRAQDLTDIEIVISDNGSVDATEEICRAAAAEDDRIVYARSERNRGMGWNYNRALELASAPLFMWNPADDVAKESYLSRCVEALARHPEAVLASTGVELIDETGAVIGRLPSLQWSGASSSPHARVQEFLDTESWDLVYGVARTDVLRSVGGMPHLVGDDVILGVDLLLRAPIVYIDEPLFQRRRHREQSSEQQDPTAGATQQTPGRTPWIHLPHWRINYELYRRALGAPLPHAERWAAARAVFTGWTVPKRRRLVGDVRRNIETSARRLRHSVSR